MHPITNEIELLRASLTGNKKAFGTIVENYQSLICSITYSATGDFGRSEELAQETFIRAWKELNQLKDLSKFRAWLCTITRNLVRQSIKKRNKDIIDSAQAIENAAAFETSELAPDETVISKEQQMVVWKAIQEIPEIYREPIVLFYRQQQSIKQVSSELNLSEEVTRQRLSRGRKLLKAEVASLVEDVLSKTGPKKTFAITVLALLPATKASAMGLAGSAGTTSLLTIINSFWAPVSSTIVGLLIFLSSGGYFTFLGFIAFSAYLILKEPKWFRHKNKRILILSVNNLILALCFFLLGKIYFSVIMLLLFIIGLLTLHPGCPKETKTFFWGPESLDPLHIWKKWKWKTPPENWRSNLIFFISTALGFIFVTIYIIYKTKPNVPWGIVAITSILALNFLVHTIRLIIKIWCCRKE